MGIDEQVVAQHRGLVVGVAKIGKSEHDAVVGGHHLHVHVEVVAQPGRDRQRPRGVDPAAREGVHDQSPVADLVAEAFDHDGPVVRHGTTDLVLLGEVGEGVGRGVVVETDIGQQLLRRRRRGAPKLSDRGTDCLAELARPTHCVAVPERQLAGAPRRWAHEHLVVGDVDDLPRRRTERKDVTDPRLVDHLFVELAHSPSWATSAGQKDPVQTAVWNRSCVDDGGALSAGASGQDVVVTIPDQPRLQLGEGVGRVAAGEHVEHPVQGRVGQRSEGVGAPDHRRQVGDRPVVHGDHGHDVLGQYVERVAGNGERLDLAVAHAFDGDRAGQQVTTVLREEDTARDAADVVPRPSDALQAAGHRRWRLDLNDQVDGTHVDAELEAARRDHGWQGALLELLLDLAALLARHRPVVGTRDLWIGDRRPPDAEASRRPAP